MFFILDEEIHSSGQRSKYEKKIVFEVSELFSLILADRDEVVRNLLEIANGFPAEGQRDVNPQNANVVHYNIDVEVIDVDELPEYGTEHGSMFFFYRYILDLVLIFYLFF